MFFDARMFNQPVPFDVTLVTDFSNMFNGALSFDQDLSNWVKTAEISVSNISLSSTSSNRRVFIDDVHRMDEQKEDMWWLKKLQEVLKPQFMKTRLFVQ